MSGRQRGTTAAPFRLAGDMKRCIAILALLLPAATLAATSAEWQRSNSDAARACRKAADLDEAAVAGAPIIFSDDSALTALLVTGRWRPAHMKGARATLLCLFDRRSRRAEVQEASGWSVR